MKKSRVFIALILLLLAWGFFSWSEPQVHFSELSGLKKSSTFHLGRYKVTYNHEVEKLMIFEDGLTKYASPPRTSFIGAGIGKARVKEVRGSFFVDEEVNQRCLKQQIESFEQAAATVILRGNLQCQAFQTGYELQIFLANDFIHMNLKFTNPAVNRVYFSMVSQADEAIFGFGEQFTYANLKGRSVPLLVMEQGIGRGAQPITAGADLMASSGGDWHTSYASFPFFMTSTMKGGYLENSEYSIFDMRHDEKTTIKVFSNQLKLRLLSGKNPKEILTDFTRYSGRMRPLPDWILNGAIVGMQGGTEKVRKVFNQLKELQTPLAAFWLQDWVGQRKTTFGKQLWWNWQLDKKHYPGWSALVADLKKNNTRVLTYINPFLADVSEKNDGSRNLFNEARQKGYLVTNQKNEPYMIENTSFSAALLDLTNAGARNWFKGIIKTEVIPVGSSGYMADFGEALPFDARLASKVDAASYHNLYAQEWARLNREVFDSLPGGDQLVFFSRAGYIRSPAYTTLFWLGDQMVSWDKYDGIKSAVTGMLTGGLSGYSLNHSDIGGYTTITNWLKDYHRSKELLKRWMELSAFTTIYRTHEGNQPSKNHQVYDDEDSMRFFDRFARVYRAWAFYRRALVQEAAETGLPVTRHMFLEYPHDKNTLNMSYQQYMLGDQLLVAPVTDQGATHKEVYLPRGTWVSVFSEEEFISKDGRTVSVAAPLGRPPVFYIKGSVTGQQFRQNLEKENLLR